MSATRVQAAGRLLIISPKAGSITPDIEKRLRTEFADYLILDFDPKEDFENDPNAIGRRLVPPGVDVYEITGPFFFGAAEKFKDRVAASSKVLILRMRHVPTIDSTGLHALRELVRRCRADGTLVLLSDVHAQPMLAMGRAQLLDQLGEDAVFGNVDDALNRARVHLGLAPQQPPSSARPTVARESAVWVRAKD